MRFVARNNGAVTRPAPRPGLGLECDKFDRAAFDAHYEAYVGKLLRRAEPRENASGGGWTMIHIDSWEMGAQNWSDGFLEEFERRRGYDPLPYLPAYAGLIVGSLERSERFLWDLRRTSSELIIENHATRFKELGRREGFALSIEPYDMNPAADLDLGAVADIPMGEFWSDGFGFNSSFSAIEAVSIAHVSGAPVVAAEAFTADKPEAWKKYPGNMKNQTDWAFCMGLNRLIFHTFVHNPLDERLRPGMTMGPYGVHWDRGQTWWPLVPAYHRYVSRCQHILSQGKPVADILYLAPEGAPQVFRPPASALEGTDVLPDKRAYSFDGCSPLALMKSAAVDNGRVVFPGGASYRLLVLPAFETMTPELLAKIEMLVKAGAVVAGGPPRKSPSLENYPACDSKVTEMALTLWGGTEPPAAVTERGYGLGKIFWGGELTSDELGHGDHPLTDAIYPDYAATAALLEKLGTRPDFSASGAVRYTHRSLPGREVYLLSNRTDETIDDTCTFRDGSMNAELWDAVSGEIRPLQNLKAIEAGIAVRVRFEPYQSFFVVFDKPGNPQAGHKDEKQVKEEAADFPALETIMTIEGPWNVEFAPAWGGPERVVFDHLIDWTKRPEEGIRHYSGIAVYSRDFDLPGNADRSENRDLYLDLGSAKHLARVNLNGRDL
ncbi:MAG: glycosyl hydrolase, partial [Candidatus Aminicenantes bacterium]|nr:glycosyl hydrolase [Candidatus Aminicenantes bacterium]